jgi:Protein of unknown function (DUF2795)
LERGSDKHGPRVDEALEHDVRPLEQGAPVEPRVEEFREQEPAADGEPEVDAVRAGGRTEAAMDPAEVHARSELARSISPSVFPARREALLDSARQNQAGQPVLDRLARLPEDQTFENVQAVWLALGGSVERPM